LQSVDFPALRIFLRFENIREQNFRDPLHSAATKRGSPVESW